MKILKGISLWSVFGFVIILSLVAFEMFNYASTKYGLEAIVGSELIFGVSWATVLAIAFCGIDLAGVARVFTPENHMRDEPMEIWFLSGAWLIGALANAVLTWWTVANIVENITFATSLVTRQQVIVFAPIFVAAIVFLSRIMIIGTISTAGEHLFNKDKVHARSNSRPKPNKQVLAKPSTNGSKPVSQSPLRPVAVSTQHPDPDGAFGSFLDSLDSMTKRS